jgi:hypothetical protein
MSKGRCTAISAYDHKTVFMAPGERLRKAQAKQVRTPSPQSRAVNGKIPRKWLSPPLRVCRGQFAELWEDGEKSQTKNA